MHRHCTITGVGNVKQVNFKPGPEDCYRRCGSDKIWQTVPDTCSGDRKSSVTDSQESGATMMYTPESSFGEFFRKCHEKV